MTSVKQSTRVLILGGLGFIGRHLVEYLLNKNNVSYIRVVDKVLPQMAWLNKKHKVRLAKSLVSNIASGFMNGNLDEQNNFL